MIQSTVVEFDLEEGRMPLRCAGQELSNGLKKPDRFRDTLAIDMLLRGASPYDVAKMLGDTIETIEKHYTPFVRELRDRVRMFLECGSGTGRCHRKARARRQGRCAKAELASCFHDRPGRDNVSECNRDLSPLWATANCLTPRPTRNSSETTSAGSRKFRSKEP
jgi:hypothetical protein